MLTLAILPVILAAFFSAGIITLLFGGGFGMFIVLFIVFKLLGK